MTFFLTIDWDVNEINSIATRKIATPINGTAIDEIYNTIKDQLSTQYETKIEITNFAEHSLLKRTEKIKHNGCVVGSICVELKTP